MKLRLLGWADHLVHLFGLDDTRVGVHICDLYDETLIGSFPDPEEGPYPWNS